MHLRTPSFGIIKSTCFYVPLFRNSFDSQPPMESVCVGTGGGGGGGATICFVVLFLNLNIKRFKGGTLGQ